MKVKLAFRPDLLRSIGVVTIFALSNGWPSMERIIFTGIDVFMFGFGIIAIWGILTKSNSYDNPSTIGVLCLSVIPFCLLVLIYWVARGFSDIKSLVDLFGRLWLMTIMSLIELEVRSTKKTVLGSSRESEMTMDAPDV